MDEELEALPTRTAEAALIDAALRHGGTLRIASDSAALDELARAGHPVRRQWVTMIASDLVARGRALRVQRGIYLFADHAGRIEPFAAGPEMVSRGYTSLWSAADHHQLTTQDVSIVSVVTDAPHPPVSIEALGYEVVFHATTPDRVFGHEGVSIGGVIARMATVEKLLIDLLWFHGTPGTPPAAQTLAIWEAANAERRFDPYLLAEMAGQMKSHALVRRVGYLLERFSQPGGDRLPDWRRGDRAPIPLLKGEVLGVPASREWGIAEGASWRTSHR